MLAQPEFLGPSLNNLLLLCSRSRGSGLGLPGSASALD